MVKIERGDARDLLVIFDNIKNKNFVIVKNGTHATILRDHKWFSKNLPIIINKN